MIEIKGYAGDIYLIILKDILYVEYKSNSSLSNTVNGLDRVQYEVIINFKERESLKLWYNGEKERSKITYDIIYDSLSELYRKNDIQSEIKKQIESLLKQINYD